MIIALHGAKGSGKDEFFKIASERNPNLKKIAFADPIKHHICNIFGLDSELAYDQFKRAELRSNLGDKYFQVDGRRVVREIGMLMRSYNEDQFTEYVEDAVYSDPNATWIITDCRFPNEVDMVRKLGGCIVKIKRPGIDYDGHVTESELPDNEVHFVIDNDGSLEDYKNKIINFLED